MRPACALLLIAAIAPLWLSACSERDVPRPAHVITPAPSHADFGKLRVHYNVLPTLAMNEAVARSYGVIRRADQALLVVALRQHVDGEEHAASGSVGATATDLSGRRQQIVLRQVSTGDYVDHVGMVQISDHDTLRFVLQAASPAGNGELKFERNF